jgi:hypothetical protein
MFHDLRADHMVKAVVAKGQIKYAGCTQVPSAFIGPAKLLMDIDVFFGSPQIVKAYVSTHNPCPGEFTCGRYMTA